VVEGEKFKQVPCQSKGGFGKTGRPKEYSEDKKKKAQASGGGKE